MSGNYSHNPILYIGGKPIPFIEGTLEWPNIKLKYGSDTSVSGGSVVVDVFQTTAEISTTLTFDVSGASKVAQWLKQLADGGTVVKARFGQEKERQGFINPFNTSEPNKNTTIVMQFMT